VEIEMNAADLFIQRKLMEYQQQDRRALRRRAERMLAACPEKLEAWLILGLVAAPRASVMYMNRAMQIDPKSEYAKAGLRWAKERIQIGITQPRLEIPQKVAKPIQPSKQRNRSVLLVVACMTAAGCIALGTALRTRAEANTNPQNISGASINLRMIGLPWMPAGGNAVDTPTPFQPASPTPSPTATTSPSPGPTSAATPIPIQPALPMPSANLPAQPGLSSGAKSIVVSLSQQRLSAFLGDQLIFNFVVSTGKNNGTAEGTFRILDKLEDPFSEPWGFWMPYWMGIYYPSSDMENGIHALPMLPGGQTIWGDALGSPVSNGCIVLGTNDARVLFAWADIGTPVTILE
jgi:lipoprotein-anchoring transpeptidase ErfK/SrfK